MTKALDRADALLLGSLGLTLLSLFLIALCRMGYTSDTVAAWVTGIFTALLVVVAWVQLSAIRETSRADFIHRLNLDVFQAPARGILRALEDEKLCMDIIGSNPKFISGETQKFDSYELDDCLLGQLESVAILERRGVIDIGLTYEFFGWYVLFVWENKVVREYVKWQQAQPDGHDVYERLAELYVKCKSIKRDH